MESLRPNNILVLCTGNSCRSQITEGFLKTLAEESANIYSAGIETHGLNPIAIQTMSEIGIDISSHSSNHFDEYSTVEFTHIITVCDQAAENCPYFPSGAQRHHFNFPDPSKASGTEEEIMEEFRRVRDMIKDYLEDFVSSKI